MSRKTRGSLIKPDEITIVHTVAKTVRNLFLLGGDLATQTHNAHRKDWILDIMEFQSSLMAIDLLGFSLMSNHIHQILRSRPDVVKKWDNLEVARRWLTLCPRSKKCLLVGDMVVRVPIAPKQTQIEALANNKRRIKKIREQLSSISWWMRLLCQKIAQRANLEDGGSLGHFWKDRFHATVIEDAAHLLGCSFYVDLNAVKAAIAMGIEDYEYTSAKIRLDMIRAKQKAYEEQKAQEDQQDQGAEPPSAEASESIVDITKGEFLSVVKLDTLSGDPQLHKDGYRCSDKGFLAYSVKEYLEALEWCIRNKIIEPESKLPEQIPDCIKNHRLGPELVIKQAREFGKMYRYWAPKGSDSDQPESSSESSSQSG